MPMNWVAGTLPSAFGSHGDWPPFWQPAIGSGKTRPSAWYEASLVATGDAAADCAPARHAIAASAAQAALLNREPPAGRASKVTGFLAKGPWGCAASRDATR